MFPLVIYLILKIHLKIIGLHQLGKVLKIKVFFFFLMILTMNEHPLSNGEISMVTSHSFFQWLNALIIVNGFST